MTKEQAENILAKPVFGDPRCIEAVKRLEEEAETQQLRAYVVGKNIFCGCCGGDGCSVCEEFGYITIPEELAAGWELDVLRDVAKDTGYYEIEEDERDEI